MRKFTLTLALGAACLGLAACGERDGNRADENSAVAEGEGNGATAAGAEGEGAGAAAGATASASFPKGARIIEENGVTYRVDADGTRVRLGENESRIVIENGVRYRVDPGGTRVRIRDDGIEIDGPDIDLPDVDVGINKKGNPDVDVGDKDPDGGR